MSEDTGCKKMFNRHFVLCLVMHLWCMTAFHMTTPQIAQYIVYLGESTTTAGFIAGIFSFLALAFRPFAGFASNRFYRKYILILGYAINMVSFFGYSLAPNAQAVLMLRILHALGLSIQSTVISVIAVDFMPKDRIVEGVGYVTIAATIGMGFGPLIGVGLTSLLGFRQSFFASGILMTASVLLLLLLPVYRHEPVHEAHLSIGSFVNIAALPLSVATLGFAYCSGLVSALLVLMGDVRGIAGIAVFFLISSVGMTLVRPFCGRYVDRKGLKSVMPFSFVSEAASMVLCAFAATLTPIVAASAFRIFGQGLAQSSLLGQVMKDTPHSERGTANATFYMMIDVGYGAGAIVGGALADWFGFEATFLSGLVLLAISAAAYVYWAKRRKIQHAADE